MKMMGNEKMEHKLETDQLRMKNKLIKIDLIPL